MPSGGMVMTSSILYTVGVLLCDFLLVNLLCHKNMDIKDDSGEGSVRKEERGRENFIFLENRMLIEMWTLKTILERSQMEIRHVYWKLEDGQSLFQSGRGLG